MEDRIPVSLRHLDRMTDSTGLIQHAIYSVPRRESGYTTDDNARALRLSVRLWNARESERHLDRVTRYLGFLEFARAADGRFHNFLSYQRSWLDTTGTDDSQGQAVLALAETCNSSLPGGLRHLAHELLDEALPRVAELRSLRALAYVVLAWGQFEPACVRDCATWNGLAFSAANTLVEHYGRAQQPGWAWFEPSMTYANAVLPHAMFVAARLWKRPADMQIGVDSFAFLESVTTVNDVFWPVGSADWYARGGPLSRYDQQPVEASTMADAAMDAFLSTGENRYLRSFLRTRAWFHGRNSLQQSLVTRGGGCFDGIQPHGLNQNQGAESTLAYLLTELQNLAAQAEIGANTRPAVHTTAESASSNFVDYHATKNGDVSCPK